MKKWIWIAIGLLAAIVLISGAYVYYKLQGMVEAPQEALQYNQEKVNAVINKQLEGMDRKSLRAKSNLILEKSVSELQTSIQEGRLTYTDLTAFYLDRIQEIDQKVDGINAVAEVNPHAMEVARERDARKDKKTSDLYGMPVTLKDNINTKDMPTSAGTHALKDFTPNEDAAVTKQLKDAGAIILAKVNLSELANYMDPKMPSGYSSKVGQTRNPFGPLKMTPSGSSSGSAAAVTSNIGVLSIGSETTGSIVAPAAIQSVVGFKPTKTSMDGKGIFPLASSLDTAGPIAKNVEDVVAAYRVLSLKEEGRAELHSLKADALKGKRIGLVNADHELTSKLKKTLESVGAEVVDVDFNVSGLDNGKIIDNDFARDVEDYAKTYGTPFKSLADLVAYNKKDLNVRARYGQRFVEEAAQAKVEEGFNDRQVALAQERLATLKREKKLDAFVSFNNEAILLPAIAGAPEITVPFGLVDGEPQGVTFIGSVDEDAGLLQLAYAFEQATKARLVPKIK